MLIFLIISRPHREIIKNIIIKDDEVDGRSGQLEAKYCNMSNNNKYPTMVGNCCLTNAFDSGTCFGEALLRKSGGGAIGYIGGSDVTYWNEDYWWGVGEGSILANPSYNNTGEGAYDGMFHNNNESNWAIVNTAIIMVGNLAVAEANGMDDYYWEIYHLMGDPSLSTYLGIPEENNVSFTPLIPVGSEAIEIQANPYYNLEYNVSGNWGAPIVSWEATTCDQWESGWDVTIGGLFPNMTQTKLFDTILKTKSPLENLRFNSFLHEPHCSRVHGSINSFLLFITEILLKCFRRL